MTTGSCVASRFEYRYNITFLAVVKTIGLKSNGLKNTIIGKFISLPLNLNIIS